MRKKAESLAFNRCDLGCPSQTWDIGWEVSPSRKLSQDAAQTRGTQGTGGNSSSPASQDKGEKAPLTTQHCKPSVPPPLLHQGMLVGSSFRCPAPTPSPISGRTSKKHIEAFGIRAPLATWVTWSRPHNTLANGANSTMPCQDYPLPSLRARSRAQAHPY